MTTSATAPAQDPTRDRAAGLVLRGVTKSLGGRDVVAAMDLEVAAGELVCLLGPSGCGKTTTLRMVGGFLEPDAGRVVIGGRDHTTTPPERRPTAMVFQNYALWPHMTVFKNVAFGLRMRRLPKTEIRERVERTLELVGLTHHIASMPGRISGGEQQRVALARALVLEPELLLLDEPLSNLDAKLRVRVREDIREIQRRVGITTVLVTHDQEEALAMADRIAVMNRGRIEQYAPPDDVYRAPATPFVAGFVGSINLLSCEVRAGSVRLANGVEVPYDGEPVPRGPAVVGVRPEDLLVTPDGARGTVVRDVPLGHYRSLTVDVGGRQLRAFVAPGFALPADGVGVRIGRLVRYALDEPAAVHDGTVDGTVDGTSP